MQPKASFVPGVLIGVGVVTCIGILLALMFPPNGILLTTTCSVGVVGSNATITISGFDAESECNHVVQSSGDSSWYELQGVNPTGNVMCEGTYNGYTFIVRDQGILNIYGNVICDDLIREGMTPTS